MASQAATLVGARKLALFSRNFRNFSLANSKEYDEKKKKEEEKRNSSLIKCEKKKRSLISHVRG